jgi:uncharacterized phage-associated protein
MLSVNIIADYFLLQTDSESGDFMTHLKLQKLVYYAQAWHLAIDKKPLFNNVIQAWAHGPVCPVLWNRFKEYGSNPIPTTLAKSDIKKINKNEIEFLGDIWNVYGQYTAKRLEEMTHSETPWIEARGSVKEYEACTTAISHSSMIVFYSKRIQK